MSRFWEGNPRSRETPPAGPERYTPDEIDMLTKALKDHEARLTQWERLLEDKKDALRAEFRNATAVLTDACDLAASILADSPYPAQSTLLHKRIDECKRRMTNFFPQHGSERRR